MLDIRPIITKYPFVARKNPIHNVCFRMWKDRRHWNERMSSYYRVQTQILFASLWSIRK